MRQEITRAHKGWALDNVALANDVTKMMKEDVSSAPAEGVYVHGLFLDGAGWDRRNCRLMEPAPKVLFTALPVVHVYAVNTAAMAKDSKDNKDALKFYEFPVYKKPRRRLDLHILFKSQDLATSRSLDFAWCGAFMRHKVAIFLKCDIFVCFSLICKTFVCIFHQ